MGKPLTGKLDRPTRYALGLFFSKIEMSADGCWVWRAARNNECYGVFGGENAHRTAYRWFVGPIEPGFHIDHLCRHRWCVNPAHLESVSRGENYRRGWRSNAFDELGYCQRGHRLTAENMSTQGMGQGQRRARICLACQRLRTAKAFAKSHATDGSQVNSEKPFKSLESETR